MPNVIEITDFAAPELDVYARLTQAQLRSRLEPEKGIFIAESPKVIARALDAGYQPISFLMERKQITGPASEVLARCGNAPVYTADRAMLAQLTGFELTRGVLCAMPTTRTITTFATASRPGTGWSRCSGTKAPRAPCWTGARWFRLSTQWPMQPAGIRPPQSRTLPPKPWHSCRNTGKCASRPENAAAHSIRF